MLPQLGPTAKSAAAKEDPPERDQGEPGASRCFLRGPIWLPNQSCGGRIGGPRVAGVGAARSGINRRPRVLAGAAVGQRAAREDHEADPTVAEIAVLEP